MTTELQPITIYHSPDADDAFMFYGLTTGAITYPSFSFKHDLKDIESLNQMTREGQIDCTAVSVHAYAYLQNNYVILRPGASFGGEDYGPRLITLNGKTIDFSKNPTIAIPGELTSAALSLKIFLQENNYAVTLKNMFFDDVQQAVKNGEVDGGVIIHEGQITHARDGLTAQVDLGKWWWDKTGLPLPLGINVVKRSLGKEAIKAVATVLRGTIEYSLNHREEALAYAMTYGRGICKADADQFVGMYVNDRTIDMGEEGVESIKHFLALGQEYKLIPQFGAIDFA